MTAEIAILNKEAVAIAADSAVTFSQKEAEKVFPSANKLFELSQYHPVGVMVYGNASFMQVPWETIIKMYRKTIGCKKSRTLREYGEDFMNFLGTRTEFFPESQQAKHLTAAVYSYYYEILSDIEKHVEDRLTQDGRVLKRTVRKVVKDAIGRHVRLWTKAPLAANCRASFSSQFIRLHDTLLDEAIENVFDNLPITQMSRDGLKRIAAGIFSRFPKGVQNPSGSGVVIAGFGEDDLFPSVSSYQVEGVVENTLKFIHDDDSSTKITFDNGGAIVPFAQSEMVHTFMRGFDPRFFASISQDLRLLFSKLPDVLSGPLHGVSPESKAAWKKRVEKELTQVFKEYHEGLLEFSRDRFVMPILDVVRSLPKSDLAALAESLVNLTSLKRRVSMDTETVGGPVDVAVISKGDGFIWLKRKHYFKPEYNPRAMARYLGTDTYDHEGKSESD